MWKNYLKIAFRTLHRNKSYAAINVLGLAVGMACCLLILLFVRDELSYDRFHEKSDRIYRIVSDWGDFSVPATNLPLVEALHTDYPGLAMARLIPFEGLMQHEDRRFREERLLFANPAVFDVFTFPLVRGDPATALTRPFTVVLTEAMAQKYFPGEDPLGQTLTFDNQAELEVTGVAEDVPASSHFHFDFLVSWATLDAAFNYSEQADWGNNSIYTYLLLPSGQAPETLEQQFPGLIARHAGEDWNGATLTLQALSSIHLRSHHNMELEANSRITYVYIFSALALFILGIACINFMNLATARSAERAKEVGVRKVAGAGRTQLIGQFLAESTVLSLVALLGAVLLVSLALPAFRTLSGKALHLEVLGDGFTLSAFLVIALVVGVLAGSYPAFVLSRFQPVTALRGALRSGAGGAALRKGLVVFQFALSIALLVGTAVVYSQLHYLRAANLGFAKEQVVALPTQTNPLQSAQLNAQYPAFKDALLQQPGVASVSISSEGLPSELLNGNAAHFEGTSMEEAPVLRAVAVGHDFFETLDVEMVAGRAFSRAFPMDSSAFVVNEAALRLLSERAPEPVRAPEDAVGKQVVLSGGRQGPLVGVAEDFNMATLHEEIEPIVFYIRPEWYDTYLVRVQPENISATLTSVRKVWAQFNPDQPFAFNFADQAFDAQYRAEERLMQIFGVFAGLAVFIACLGLFGLAAYMAQQRTKEIGIRKALGASAASIVAMLSKDFLKLVLVAFVLATPVAYFAMQRWLADFAYRTALSPWFFLGAGVLAFAVAAATVSYQSLKAAQTNPTDALRAE